MPSLNDILQVRTYPGRGVLLARTASGELCVGYFLTGRSPASREREMVALPNGDIEVRSTSADAAQDDLRHYVAAARRGAVLVVGNGNQVMPLAHDLAQGTDTLRAFSPFEYEPDGPIFTPRVWVATTAAGVEDWVFGAAVRGDRPGGSSDTLAWIVGAMQPGDGALLSTYDGTVEQVSTARGPVDFSTAAQSPTDFLDEIWNALPAELRVAALAFESSSFPAAVQVRSRA